MQRRFYTFLICLLAISAFAAEPLEPCPLDIRGAASTQVGVLVRDIRTGEVVADVNSDATFVPASVTKALTTASVLSQLSPEMTFSTECVAEGKISGGVLNGNIVIRCSSDPTLDSSYFKAYGGICDSIVSHIKAMGINRIEGRILFDYPLQVADAIPQGWMQEDLVETYGAAHDPLNFRDNRLTVNLSTGAFSPASPKIPVARIDGNGVKRDRSNRTLYIGRKAKGSRTIANPDPQATFENLLTTMLTNAGITVGDKKIGVTEDDGRIIYSHKSPSFEEIMRSLMFRSDNLMAEGMLRTLAPEMSRKAACQREMSLWEARGIDTTPIFVEDGSGLSRKNRISPRFLSDVLRWMALSDDAEMYVSFFPKAGREGTMRNSYVNTSLEGRLATKTGSMRGVRCLAGYLLDDNGVPTHTVVVMVNAYKCDKGQLNSAIGKYLIESLNLQSE